MIGCHIDKMQLKTRSNAFNVEINARTPIKSICPIKNWNRINLLMVDLSASR